MASDTGSYVPYGMDRAKGYMEKIADAQLAQKNALIRKELVGGEMLQAGMQEALQHGTKGYSDASTRYADAAAMEGKKKFNKIRATGEVESLDGTIESMEELLKTTKDPVQKLQMIEKLNGYKKRRAMWTAARDATNMEEFAKIAGAQSRIDKNLQETKAKVAEGQAAEVVVDETLMAPRPEKREGGFDFTKVQEIIDAQEPTSLKPLNLAQQEFVGGNPDISHRGRYSLKNPKLKRGRGKDIHPNKYGYTEKWDHDDSGRYGKFEEVDESLQFLNRRSGND